MPNRKKSNLSNVSNAAKKKRSLRSAQTTNRGISELEGPSRVSQSVFDTGAQSEQRLARNRESQATRYQRETEKCRQARLERDRLHHILMRKTETEEDRSARLEERRTCHAVKRKIESEEGRQGRLEKNRLDSFKANLNISIRKGDRKETRTTETTYEHADRLSADAERDPTVPELESYEMRIEERERQAVKPMQQWCVLVNSGLCYDPTIKYSEAVEIGCMNFVCCYCKALTWKGEAKGICCSSGKVILPPILEAPEPLQSLLKGNHPLSQNFLQHIRAYNSAFQMTSFGAAKTSEECFMPTFRVQGQVYHLIGSLLPPANQPSSFLQIYFISDVQNQVDARLNNFSTLNFALVQQLQELLHVHNSYVKSFKSALESMPHTSDEYKFIIKADRTPTGEHPGRFNAPITNEVAIVMVGEQSERRDIVLRTRSKGLTRICETHRSYDALQYPLMFCRGEDGYNFCLFHTDPATGSPLNRKISACEFYAYRAMVRQQDPNMLHKFKQLWNQYLVDMYAKIESERLLYIRTHQKQLRAESYIQLKDALRQETSLEDLGQVIILPSSFTGGPRYMHSHTQDAFCYVRKFGWADLFITVTTNPKWPEIQRELSSDQAAKDRHDIVARVFHLKLKCFIALLTKSKIFGRVRCYIYTVEWQKRGLPHAHILLWLEEPIRPDRVDKVISAELPNCSIDPELYDIVKCHMIHGPCGPLNPNSPCMKGTCCSKKYPRKFMSETVTGENGYPTYRRRAPDADGFTAVIKVGAEFITVDNRWVVPYSPVLLRAFKIHINVEYCSSVKSIKYICKYVNKGSDGITMALCNNHDEVKMYQSGRYISTSEAVWRILSFPIHERYPPVIHLDIHLENGQRIYFRPDNVKERVERPTNTTLMAFFKLCQADSFAKTLLYSDVPAYYTFNKSLGKFLRRKLGQPVQGYPGIRRDAAIGRVYTIHPGSSECYYLRLLLLNVKGPTSFEYLRTIRGEAHPTFQSACRALGLLEDDSNWDDTLREASVSDSPKKLRDLFCMLLTFCNLSNPLNIWMKFRDFLAEDYLREEQKKNSAITFESAPQLYEMCLSDISLIMYGSSGLSLQNYGLPSPQTLSVPANIEYSRETSYDSRYLASYVDEMEPLMTSEQRDVFLKVLSSIKCSSSGSIFFLDAPGGTGKTFLIKLLLSKVRQNEHIALAVASSGIAATLLPGGRTAHSMFKIPLNVDQMDTPVCNISRNSAMAPVLKECCLIVWDECTMSHKKSIEALHRTLMDIKNNTLIMGGVTVLLSGDFRQTLPIVTNGTRADEVNSSLKRSFLWSFVERLSLKTNMRVHLAGDRGAHTFSEVLLGIGDGTLLETDGFITIPPSLATVVSSQEELIDKVFPGVQQLPYIQSSWLCERAILTPTNQLATTINKKIMTLFHGEERIYRSVNTVLNQDDAVHYPVEFLDSVTACGLPAHELTLKVGAPIMLLRNLSVPKLCNGTRLRVRALYTYVIEADIITGCGVGESVFIPRIPIVPSNYPFQFKRLQFPVSACFAMTVSKSQGQTLSTAGVELSETSCFSHGQLYVACSRVRSSTSLFIYTPHGRTVNVVYKEALTN